MRSKRRRSKRRWRRSAHPVLGDVPYLSFELVPELCVGHTAAPHAKASAFCRMAAEAEAQGKAAPLSLTWPRPAHSTTAACPPPEPRPALPRAPSLNSAIMAHTIVRSERSRSDATTEHRGRRCAPRRRSAQLGRLREISPCLCLCSSWPCRTSMAASICPRCRADLVVVWLSSAARASAFAAFEAVVASQN